MTRLFFARQCKQFFKTRSAAMLLVLCSFLVIGAGEPQVRHTELKTSTESRIPATGRMFLIAVIDSDDDTIGRRCEQDLDEITFTFEELADWLDMELQEPKVIKGGDFSKAAVNEALDGWLADQSPSKADVVVFYYSGHGFRYPDDASEYPRMWLKTKEDKQTETTNLRIEEDIFERIIQMGGGINLVLSDCCNTSVAGVNAQIEEQAPPAPPKRTTHKRKRSQQTDPDDAEAENAEKLFKPNRSLNILATAAGPGEFAAGKPSSGGFFTTYLVQAINDCVYDDKLEPTWESIIKFADKNAAYWAKSAPCPNARHNAQGRCIQAAKYKIVGGD